MRSTALFAAAVSAAITLLFGCGGGDGDGDGSGGTGGSDEHACLEPPADATCDSALYGFRNGEIAPTFDEVYTNTLVQKCASSSACHAGDNAPLGLRFDIDQASAYEALLNQNAEHGNARVEPNDLSCGEVIKRIESDDPAYQMPPGVPLTEEERCAIRHWIANGATE